MKIVWLALVSALAANGQLAGVGQGIRANFGNLQSAVTAKAPQRAAEPRTGPDSSTTGTGGAGTVPSAAAWSKVTEEQVRGIAIGTARAEGRWGTGYVLPRSAVLVKG